MSAHQLHRMLGITYKSAWFMAHRLRYAMQDAVMLLDGIVEVRRNLHRWPSSTSGSPGPIDSEKTPVVALVERGGRVRANVLHRVTADNVHE